MEAVYAAIIVFSLTYLYYRNWMAGKNFSKAHRADGKTAIVTETAIGLAERGVRVIVACSDLRRGEIVSAMIKSKTGNPNIRAMHLNLASFKSIRAFAETFLKEETRLDILVNNETVTCAKKSFTEDGLEMHMAVNHFGHFLLTMLLIKRMRQFTPSRIVTVSHHAHRFVRFNKDNLNSERTYNRFHAFCHSKLANLIFTNELSNRLSCSGVTATSVHPGIFHVDTSHITGSLLFEIFRGITDIFAKIILRTAKSGAQNTLYAALDFNLQNISGVYIDNFEIAHVNPDADDPELRSWLWDYSEKITGIGFPTDDWYLDDSYKNISKYTNFFGIPTEIYEQSLK
ncbi:Retinol dehydrogenase 11 [Pseudolycoriella hygida]|uniref:Retinol dehydrogenase 11 n=1 Tax=Pseudolycoriella hygida TaxID=35572 RepID=A0A9Q0S2Q0_9DIPT|nr:Retinol dehydrogenase 11 [Pseudolycoriella hygida]